MNVILPEPQAATEPMDWPEPPPLPDSRPAVMGFDEELLPESLRPWISDISERIQCPPDFPAIGAMTALASTIGRQVGIRPKRRDDWLVVANLWGAVIGRPGIMKSPALSEGMKPLNRLAYDARKEAEQARKEAALQAELSKARIAALKGDLKKASRSKDPEGDPAEIMREIQSLEQAMEPPAEKRYIVNDPTVEALGEILAENRHGVLIFRDELVGWLKSLDKDGAENARPFYLEAWSGTGSYTFDRIGRGRVHIESACVSILGGIQPGPLGDYVRGAAKAGRGADGLLQRFQLLVYPDDSGDWRDVDRYPNSEAKNRAFETFERLANLHAGDIGALCDDGDNIPWLRFDDDAQGLFREWRQDLETNKLRSGEPEIIESHLSKYRKLVPALALVCHLADSPNGGPVTESALVRAAAWAEYLETHARRIYATAINPDIPAAHALLHKIRTSKVADGFSFADVYLKGWKNLHQTDVEPAAKLLEELGYLRIDSIPTGGRPRIECRINPKIRGAS